MKVVEIFQSIDGEAFNAGKITNFIRLSGCNLRCNYCDTIYGQKLSDGEEMSIDDILKKLDKGIKNITLTGGEPLLNKENAYSLLNTLVKEKYNVSVETNGSIDMKDFVKDFPTVAFIVDYKSPSSEMQEKMLINNFNILRPIDCVKFVVGDILDLKTMEKVYKETELVKGKTPIFVSPVFGKIELVEIVEFLKTRKLNDIRMQIQMHKIIWSPETKGV